MSTITELEESEFKLAIKPRQEPESNRRFVISLLIPAIVIFVAAILVPIVLGIYVSFTNSGTTPGTGYLGTQTTILQYYLLLVYPNSPYDFWRYTYQTLFFSVVSLSLEFVLGLGFALILNKKFKGRSIARTTLLIPWAIPTVASATIFRFEIFNPAGPPFFGLINSLFQIFGLQPISFFGVDAPILLNLPTLIPYAPFFTEVPIKVTMIVAIMIDVWKTTPFITLLILAALQIVPDDLYKAGDIAGASGWQKFRFISWPLIKSGVGIALIFRAMQALRVYDAIVVFNDDSVHSMTWKAVQLWLSSKYGLASAISVLLLIIVVIFAFVILLVTRRTEKKPKEGKSTLQKIVGVFKRGKVPEKPISPMEEIETIVEKPQVESIRSLSVESTEKIAKTMPLEPKAITISKRKVSWYKGTRKVRKVLFVVIVVAMCLFCAGPFLWVLLRSFRDPYTLSGPFAQTSFELFPKYLSIRSYILLFTNVEIYGVSFGLPLLNGFILSGLTVVVVIFAGVLIAYAISRFNFPFKRGLYGFIFSMNSLPPLIIVIPYYIQIYLVSQFIPFLNVQNNLYGLILPYSAFNLPLAVFILVAFFAEIPEDLWKAAKVDGASNFQVLRKVILPLTVPGIFTVAILTFIASWNELLFAQVFLINPEIQTVPRAILRYVYNQGTLTATWNTQMVLLAATSAATVPLVIVVLIFQKRIVSGLTRGAVKG